MDVEQRALPYCDVRPRIARPIPPDLPDGRMRAIRVLRATWLSGTVIHYFLLPAPEAQRQAVRDAFQEWKKLPLGLEFVEVTDRSEAEVRVGFDQSDGSWSYVGKDVLEVGTDRTTMNFGWDLTDDYGHTTALHEIGHTLGLPHEHQNPFAGIVWDEPRVYGYFGGPPNHWSQQQTFSNVLRKLDPTEVEGSEWDPDSVMEYWFPGGLIKEPTAYRDGLRPAGGLSSRDIEWVKRWYPVQDPVQPRLMPFVSVPLSLGEGEQADFVFEPDASRRYEFGTFGAADTVMVLFEDVDGELRYRRGDDDSGQERNARLDAKLYQGRRYVVRVRLYWAGESGRTAVMCW